MTSEFGRTPNINGRDGRDHWPYCFTAFLAGGGIKGGMTYGETDKTGRTPTEGKPIKPEDLNATIAHTLGLPLNDYQYSPSGRPFTIAHKGRTFIGYFNLIIEVNLILIIIVNGSLH